MKRKSKNLLNLLLLVLVLCGAANSDAVSARNNSDGDGIFSAPGAQTGKTIIAGAKAKKIDELMRVYEQAGILSGTILVAEKGNVIYKRGFGYAHAEFKVPNQPDTKFRIASVSKPVVAILVMKLVEQGKISLDGRVSDYLPDFRKDANKITVRHLLSHTSGLPGGAGSLDGREMRDPVTRAELMKPSAENQLEFEPGTKMRYGGASYVVLAMIVEKIAGKPYGEVLRETIFEPLGMRDTGIEDAAGTVEMPPGARMRVKNPNPVIERLATGYVKTREGYIRAPYMDMSRANVSAAMHSTVEDLFRLDRALSNDKFFSKQSRELMFTPVLEDTALGWNVRNIAFEDLQKPLLRIFPEDALRLAPADLKMIYKGGDLWGFTSFWARLPEKDQTIIALLNGGNIYFNANAVRMTQGIVNILHDKPHFTPGEAEKPRS
jgi:CubicO group peptidase (beta-lactamase class C family)